MLLTIVLLQVGILWQYGRQARGAGYAGDPGPDVVARAVADPAPADPGGSAVFLGWREDDLLPVARRMHHEMNRFVRSPLDEWRMLDALLGADMEWGVPAHAMDLRTDAEMFCVEVSLPGARRENVSAELDERLLFLAATVELPGGGHSRFQQRLLLPGPVAADGKAIVELTNGLLRVSVPRAMGASQETTRPGRQDGES